VSKSYLGDSLKLIVRMCSFCISSIVPIVNVLSFPKAKLKKKNINGLIYTKAKLQKKNINGLIYTKAKLKKK
jgi:uncharacterized protein YjbI with pentapeptide repeats